LNREINSMTTRAYAKINLDLRLGQRRSDGFHPIDTFFIRVDLYDNIKGRATQDGNCTLSILGDTHLSAGPDNLVLRAARAMQRFAQQGAGVHLELEKRIPQGAGLGGGSSDAASTLTILQKLWSTSCTDEQMAALGAELGSDVPFFLQPYASRGTGRGEILHPSPMKDLPWAVLIHPGFPSPTASAYASYAQSPKPGVEGPKLTLRQRNGMNLTLRPRNDLEEAVEKKFLWIRSAREWLQRQPGALAARMSGSGSTVFGLWPSDKEAEQVANRAKKHFGSEAWIQATRLICGAK